MGRQPLNYNIVSPALGTFDKQFFKLKPMQKLEHAFDEIESAFGATYARRIRDQLDSVPLNFKEHVDDFGEFFVRPHGKSPRIELASNFGNAKIMALTGCDPADAQVTRRFFSLVAWFWRCLGSAGNGFFGIVS